MASAWQADKLYIKAIHIISLRMGHIQNRTINTRLRAILLLTSASFMPQRCTDGHVQAKRCLSDARQQDFRQGRRGGKNNIYVVLCQVFLGR